MASSHSRQSSSSSSIANFFRRPSSSHHYQDHTPADFEFQESDLYFNDHSSPTSLSTIHSSNASKIQKSKSRRSAKVADESRSVPVSIPVSWSTSRLQAESEISDDDDDDNEEKYSSRGDQRVPPHEYLARKRGASLSVHEGVGRTLKGRDMSRVRNAVWKRIGFED